MEMKTSFALSQRFRLALSGIKPKENMVVVGPVNQKGKAGQWESMSHIAHITEKGI